MKPSSATSSSSTVEKLREFSKSSDLMDGAGELLRQAADELEEEEAIRTRMAALLAETAIALKGPEKPLHGHNWSNLPKIAAELKLACDIGEVLLEQERETRRSEIAKPAHLTWIRFDSDCIINGVEVKAGTSWGPFEKSKDISNTSLSAIAKRDPFIVWEVENKTTRVLFSTKEAADKFVSTFPASVAGGMRLQEVAVI